jgi:hypothetical protein
MRPCRKANVSWTAAPLASSVPKASVLTFSATFINIPSVSFLQAQERDVGPDRFLGDHLGQQEAQWPAGGLLVASSNWGCSDSLSRMFLGYRAPRTRAESDHSPRASSVRIHSSALHYREEYCPMCAGVPLVKVRNILPSLPTDADRPNPEYPGVIAGQGIR